MWVGWGAYCQRRMWPVVHGCGDPLRSSLWVGELQGALDRIPYSVGRWSEITFATAWAAKRHDNISRTGRSALRCVGCWWAWRVPFGMHEDARGVNGQVNFALKMMKFVSKMMNFVSKLMQNDGNGQPARHTSAETEVLRTTARETQSGQTAHGAGRPRPRLRRGGRTAGSVRLRLDAVQQGASRGPARKGLGRYVSQVRRIGYTCRRLIDLIPVLYTHAGDW